MPARERDDAASALPPLSAYAWDVMTPGETWRDVVLPRLDRAETDRGAAEEIYACLRNRAHELVAGRRHKGDIAGWHDLIRRAAVLLRDAGREDLAFRTEALSDLVYMTHVNAARHDADAVMRRKHVREILALVAGAGGDRGFPRADVIRRLGILDANLSRILQVIEGAGLIVRTSHGKETRLALTPEGRRRAAQLPAAPEPPASGRVAVQRSREFRRPERAAVGSAIAIGPEPAPKPFEPRIGLEQPQRDRGFRVTPAQSRTPAAAGGY